MRLYKNKLFVAFAMLLLIGSIDAAELSDLLNEARLGRHLKIAESQKKDVSRFTQSMQKIVSDYQWEHAKRLCEANLWQGNFPNIADFQTLRKNTNMQVAQALEDFGHKLNPDQVQRLNKLLENKGRILRASSTTTPFPMIRNTPLFTRFEGLANAYYVSPQDTTSAYDAWTYSNLLTTWSVRSYIPDLRPIDEAEYYRQPGIADRQDRAYWSNSSMLKARMVESPLLVTATLMVPDLVQKEVQLLQAHYLPKNTSPDAIRKRYAQDYRLAETVAIRLKMSTPYDSDFLSMDRWGISLEDGEGNEYEPTDTRRVGQYPLEALQIRRPDKSIEVIDAFGDLYPSVPSSRSRFYLEAPTSIVFMGNEQLVVLFFKVNRSLILGEGAKYLKMTIRDVKETSQPMKLVWQMKRSKPIKKVSNQ